MTYTVYDDEPIPRQAFCDGHTDDEKIQWIYKVTNMATINSITKDELKTALKWLFDFAFHDSDESRDVQDAEPEEKPHGHWIPSEFHSNVTGETYPEQKCSYCGTAFDAQMIPFEYCPHCGTEMDGEWSDTE